jgi:hypothetical protein
MERKPDFTFKCRESVKWLLDGRDTGFYSLNEVVVSKRVEEMKNSGWCPEKILDSCIACNIHDRGVNTISLFQIVYFDHPILKEYSDEQIRAALYGTALRLKAEEEALLISDKLFPGVSENKISPGIKSRRIYSLQRFAKIISQEVAPSHEIRNR